MKAPPPASPAIRWSASSISARAATGRPRHEPAGADGRAGGGLDDRARRSRRHAHLFHPALRQFRAWRIHLLGRLFCPRRRRRAGCAFRQPGCADRSLLLRLGADHSRAGRHRLERRVGAARRRAALRPPACAEKHCHHHGDGELWRSADAAIPARIHLHLAAALLLQGAADRHAARRRHTRDARPAFVAWRRDRSGGRRASASVAHRDRPRHARGLGESRSSPASPASRCAR